MYFLLKFITFFRYTATKGFEGPVFGSSDKWNGLGVFFDSFDNDNKHNNPYIMVRFIYKLSIFESKLPNESKKFVHYCVIYDLVYEFVLEIFHRIRLK